MFGHGLTAEEIAGRLNLARKTVESHRRRAKEKLRCTSLNELVAFAVRWTVDHPEESDR
jgi:DNA-binding CsgD family transcriptional regulator